MEARISKENTTFHYELASKENSKGLFPVLLRLTQDRKKWRVKTGVAVKKKYWLAKDQKVSATDPESKQKNNTLAKKKLHYLNTYEQLRQEGKATPENIIALIEQGHISDSFLTYAKERTKAIYNAGGIRNYKKYSSFVKKLEKYLESISKQDLLFSELTPAFLARFDEWLHGLRNERHPDRLLHQNAIAVIFNIFKTLANRAISIDEKMKPEQNPFLKFKYITLKTEKEKLDGSELDKIKGLDLEEGSLIWHCRNYFFFSFYCAGIRVGDLIQLRWMNITPEGRLTYQMGKNHKVRDLKLVQPALDILRYYKKEGAKPTDYIFPILQGNETWAKYVTMEQKDTIPADEKKRMFEVIGAKNALINKELAKIQKLAGLEKRVSFHISRHSFAKAAKDAGIDNLEVKALLAHTNLSTTQKYMGEFDTQKNDAALDSIFGKNEEETLLQQLQGVDKELLKKVLEKLNNINN